MPQPTRLYLIRHGQSAGNAEGRFGGHGTTPLSELGIQQAEKTAKVLAKEGINVIYSSDLHRAGGISKATMREYDDLCMIPVKEVTARDVVRIRSQVKVSQNLFARYLNTSESTVQKWETGAKKPGGIASKLLRIVEKHGLDVLA